MDVRSFCAGLQFAAGNFASLARYGLSKKVGKVLAQTVRARVWELEDAGVSLLEELTPEELGPELTELTAGRETNVHVEKALILSVLTYFLDVLEGIKGEKP